MSYKLYNDDCVNVCRQLPDDCIDLTITSIPFANLYTYSDDPRDFSNVKDLNEFFQQMDYLIPELYRITRPGAHHCITRDADSNFQRKRWNNGLDRF